MLALVLQAAPLQGQGWEAAAPLPVEMGNMAHAVVDDRLVLAGGVSWKSDKKIFLDGIWTRRADQPKWEQVGRLPRPNAYASFGASGGTLFLLGGSDGERMSAARIHIERNGQAEQPGQHAGAVVYAGSVARGPWLYEVGGAEDVLDTRTLTRRFRRTHMTTGATEDLPPYPAGEIMLPAAAICGAELLVFGGMHYDGAGQVQNLNDAFVYSFEKQNWERLPPYPIAARGVSACSLDDRRILLGGGYTDGFTSATFVYDRELRTYLPSVPLPLAALTHLIRWGNHIYMLGGEDRMRHRTDSCFRIERAKLTGD